MKVKPSYHALCFTDQWLVAPVDERLVHATGSALADVRLTLPATVLDRVVGDLVAFGDEWRVPVLLWIEATDASLFQKLTLQPWQDAVHAADGAYWCNVNRHFNRLIGRDHVCAIVGCKESSQRFTPEVQRQAYAAGRLAAIAGFTVLTGGLSGVMSKAAEGAAAVGGATIGLLPGTDKREANKHIRTVLPSGIGIARNYQIALGCDVMIALNGGRGTMEEMCFALDFERPVMSWSSWTLDEVEIGNDEADVLRFLLSHKQRLMRALRDEAYSERD